MNEINERRNVPLTFIMLFESRNDAYVVLIHSSSRWSLNMRARARVFASHTITKKANANAQRDEPKTEMTNIWLCVYFERNILTSVQRASLFGMISVWARLGEHLCASYGAHECTDVLWNHSLVCSSTPEKKETQRRMWAGER